MRRLEECLSVSASVILTSASDVWNWGATLLEMFNGRCTWEDAADAPAALSEISLNGSAINGPLDCLILWRG
jgi:hypothetical protein